MSTSGDEDTQNLLPSSSPGESTSDITGEEGVSPRTSTMPKRNSSSSSNGIKLKKCCIMILEIIYWLVTLILVQFWKQCTTVALSCMLAYWLWGGTATFLLMLAAIFGIFYNLQDNVLYFPNEPESSRFYVPPASALGIPYEHVTIPTSDKLQLNAVLFKQSDELTARVPTVIFFHGNAGNIGHRFMNLYELHAACGCNILAVDYRGFGKSEGNPCEEGLYLDGEAALSYLHTRADIDQSRIILFGRSLGGAIVIHIASQRHNQDRIAGLIIENTFTSIPDMGSVLFNLDFIRWLPLCFVKNKYFSIKKVSRIKVPTLFLSGSADELVPPKMMQALFQLCAAPSKKMARFEDGTHNETWRCREYFGVIRNFVNNVSRSSSSNPMEPTAPSASASSGPSLAEFLDRTARHSHSHQQDI